MYKILQKTQFSENVFKFRIEAAEIAKHAHAGQFLMVRANELSERVPFTFADWDVKAGWVEFIFMVIGKTTRMLATYQEGDFLQDVTGPLGMPTQLKEGRWAVIGGGVGVQTRVMAVQMLGFELTNGNERLIAHDVRLFGDACNALEGIE